MEIHGPHGPNGTGPVFSRRPIDATDTARTAGIELPRDEISISSQARILAEISEYGVHPQQVEEIRQQIAQGVYETPEKLAIAVDGLLNELRAGRLSGSS